MNSKKELWRQKQMENMKNTNRFLAEDKKKKINWKEEEKKEKI